jgi:signal peptidase I
LIGSISRPAQVAGGAIQTLAAVSLLILILALLVGVLPSILGYESYVVYGGSMEPAIGTGDLAVVGPVRPEQFRIGDVITYRTPDRPEVIVTHRLVGMEPGENGQLSFQTKGDANDTVDKVLVQQRAVLGRVAYTIPRIGYLVDFARRVEGKILLIVIPGVLLALDYLLELRRRNRDDQGVPLAVSLATQARVALRNGDLPAVQELADRAIAIHPRLDEAWLLKAQCFQSESERRACLQAALTVNPKSARLRDALQQVIAPQAVRS